ncbi:sigma-70 family RNA polymerase sigma factor [Cytobacillus oceanisediminis]|uniref:sigma-70 family RNA polymerase sigma factor n=1 Tax=Cytobacillus oceanisediminis TaxID=665099 RepID=UPI001C21E2B2|nr:sigma-70 family RNA polymerase sigma factor [Cytobacillus oceanisediminis]MBU8733767.1 sigma-70 family RNA polymerase sigma factor [Cytobacillus oceanisediminis]
MSLEEQFLVEQIKLKNEKGISNILDKYGGLLNAIIQKYLQKNREDTEECMADVLVSIWYHIDSFDPSRNEFKNWIAAIAKYKAIDYLRKSEQEKQYLSKAELSEGNLGQLVSDKNKVDTENLLDELPELERSIFEKYYLEGFPSREIAKQFNTKESWVHNKLSRGRKKLRSILMRNEVKKNDYL